MKFQRLPTEALVVLELCLQHLLHLGGGCLYNLYVSVLNGDEGADSVQSQDEHRGENTETRSGCMLPRRHQ